MFEIPGSNITVLVLRTHSVVDPGFPAGWQPHAGNFQFGNILKHLYVKKKESGPLGGAPLATCLDTPMVIAIF